MQTPNTGMQTPNDDIQSPNTGIQAQNDDIQSPNTGIQAQNDDIHVPSESSESDTDSDGWGYDVGLPTPPPICSKERHPHTLFSVDPWSSHCLEYGGKILVVARTEEECCDILYQEYGGHRSEIECRVRYSDTLWLASSNMSSGIWQKILH